MKTLTQITLISLAGLFWIAASCEREDSPPIFDSRPYYPVMFYNVENLFDTLDQEGTFDEEFMPLDEKEWNTAKLYDKLEKIARVVQDADTMGLPSLIGLCEVENRDVLEMLLAATDLRDAGYRIVHKESPDYRGIDVALLYREGDFELLDYWAYPVWFPYDTDFRTREVLHVKGQFTGQAEPVHVFVNHWPSRSGGEIETRPKRIFVAELVRTKVDSILAVQADERIVIMGDLNDEPNDLSVTSGLNALTDFDRPDAGELYALSAALMKNSDMGSYKYKGNWNHLDQFIVSGSLLDTLSDMYTRPSDIRIVSQEYLLEKDEAYLGMKPYRTYLGDYFHGGYSDHLPVILRLRYRN